jgi:hypothetical protein
MGVFRTQLCLLFTEYRNGREWLTPRVDKPPVPPRSNPQCHYVQGATALGAPLAACPPVQPSCSINPLTGGQAIRAAQIKPSVPLRSGRHSPRGATGSLPASATLLLNQTPHGWTSHPCHPDQTLSAITFRTPQPSGRHWQLARQCNPPAQSTPSRVDKPSVPPRSNPQCHYVQVATALGAPLAACPPVQPSCSINPLTGGLATRATQIKPSVPLRSGRHSPRGATGGLPASATLLLNQPPHGWTSHPCHPNLTLF